MPVVIFSACLDLEQISSFMDRHYLTKPCPGGMALPCLGVKKSAWNA